MPDFSLSDIAAATGSDCKEGWGGSSAWVLIILFALIFGWGGNGFGNNGAAAATTADIQRAVDLNSIQEGQRSIAADVQRTAYENMATTKDAAYNNLSETRDVEAAMGAGFANVQNSLTAGFANQAQCCCETQRAIDGVNYNAAMNTASINANTTAQTQKVLDAISQGKIDSLQAEVTELRMQQMMCGVPRINPFGYGIVPTFPAPPTTTTTTTAQG